MSNPETQRPKRAPRKQAPIALISMGLMAAVLLTLVILCLVPGAGKSTKNPVIAFYGDEGNVPALSLRNTLHAAGFEYEFLSYGESLPDASDVVVAGVGADAVYVINEYKDDPHVIGFVLICPELNEDFMEGLSSLNPACDVAIFAGRDDADSVPQMGAARLIYERMSGDDTLFTPYVKRGGLFSSKVYFNNAQNRMLSLSAFKVNDASKLLFSPLFQNELAGYLSVTYIDESTREISFGRINSWFVFCWLSFMFAVVSLLLYISNMSLSESGNDPKKAPVSKWVFGVIGGVSIAVAIGIIATTFSETLNTSMPMILVLLPVLFMLTLFIINFKWIYAKEGKFIPSKKTLIPSVFMAVVIGLYAMLITALTMDLRVYAIRDAGLSSGLLTALLVVDITLATGLIYSSRKSSTAGEGAKNCFGNRIIFALMFLPSVAAFLFGLIPGNQGVFYAGLAGIAATGLPYLAVMPIVRHTDRSLVPGVLHGVVFVLVLAAAL